MLGIRNWLFSQTRVW